MGRKENGYAAVKRSVDCHFCFFFFIRNGNYIDKKNNYNNCKEGQDVP